MPQKFVVKASKDFLKSLDELSPAVSLAIMGKLKLLEEAPLPTGKNRIKKLKGYNPRFIVYASETKEYFTGSREMKWSF